MTLQEGSKNNYYNVMDHKNKVEKWHQKICQTNVMKIAKHKGSFVLSRGLTYNTITTENPVAQGSYNVGK